MAHGQADPSGATLGATAPTRGRTAAGSVGVLLDGRYRLLQRRTRDGAAATWDGEDDQLLRPVVVHVVSGATAAEAVDAARRSAAVEDDRLPHLLDAGLDRAADGTALGWVVTERSPGRALAELLREAPLPPARARALVGEAAAVLTRASRSGLHHRRLDPSCVLLTADGAVSVLGLEVAAAAAGLPRVSPAEADREDAEGLVRVLYAAVTGLWPAGRSGSLGAAPTGRGGAPVSPGQLAAGVPADLDALCDATLGPYRQGPASPAAVAAKLAPWGSATGPVTRTGLGITLPPTEARPVVPVAPTAAPTAVAPAPAPLPVPPPTPAPPAPAAWTSAPVRARLGGGPGLHFAGTAAEQHDDDGAAAPAAPVPTAPHPLETAAEPAGTTVVHETRASRRAALRRAERAAAPAAAPAPPAETVQQFPTVHVPRAPRGPQPAAAAAATAAAPRSTPAPAPAAAAGRPSTFSDTDATDWVGSAWGSAPHRGERRQRQQAVTRTAPRTAPRTPDREPAGDQRSRWPVVAAVAALALAVGTAGVVVASNRDEIAGALGIGTSSAAGPDLGAPQAPAPSVEGSAAPSAPTDPAGPGEVTSARAEDPFGDGTENDASTGRAVDGDPSTGWASSTYTNAELGNLKRGVGLALVLGSGTDPSLVSALTLQTQGTGGTLEVRSSPDGGYEGSTVLATTEAGTDGRAVDVDLPAPVEATHLLLWFTQLPTTSGGYTAVVDEVSVR